VHLESSESGADLAPRRRCDVHALLPGAAQRRRRQAEPERRKTLTIASSASGMPEARFTLATCACTTWPGAARPAGKTLVDELVVA